MSANPALERFHSNLIWLAHRDQRLALGADLKGGSQESWALGRRLDS